MTNRFLGAALALASLISPTIAAAQVADRAGAPSGTAPLQAPCVVQANGTCAAVKDTVPMPVVITSRPTGTNAGQVQGTNPNGTTDIGNPVTVAGSDGTNTRTLRTDADGRMQVEGGVASGNADSGRPVKTGGYASGGIPGTVVNGQRVNDWNALTGAKVFSPGSATLGYSLSLTASPSLVQDANGSARPLGVIGMVTDGANGVFQRDANTASGTTGTGLLGVGNLGFDGTNWRPFRTATDGTLIGIVQGERTAGTTDGGNPVKIGGFASTAAPTAVTAGQRVNAWYNLNGAAVMQIADSGGGLLATRFAGDAGGTAQGLITWNQNAVFNGATWDRARGDTTGAYTVEKGGPSIATSQTSVGTTAALVAPTRVGRNKVTVTIGAANSCVLGNAGVTLSTGYPLQPVAGASITLDTAAAIYAVCNATTTVSDVETF